MDGTSEGSEESSRDSATKTCSVCKKVLPLPMFHRRSHYVRRGLRAACKACTREATQKARAGRPPAAFGWKEKVRFMTREAIRVGELVPEPCVSDLGLGRRCGVHEVQPHHPRYDGEDAHLEVVWLCRLHHALEHGKRGWTRQLDLFPAPSPRPSSDGSGEVRDESSRGT